MPMKTIFVVMLCTFLYCGSIEAGQVTKMQKFFDFWGSYWSNDWRISDICRGNKFSFTSRTGRWELWVWHSLGASSSLDLAETYRVDADDEKPAIHLNYSEVQAYCEWAGKRLPKDEEWASAAYLEQRNNPPAGFDFGKTYGYPIGNNPTGANYLRKCGPSLSVD